MRKPVEIKQLDEQGEFEAIVATLNVIDKDGDVIRPGAFGEQVVTVLPAHNWESVPLGKATITEQDGVAVAKGRFNLDTQAGREWHSSLKFDLENGPARQEWSFGFQVSEFEQGRFENRSVRFLDKLEVHEVSPVLVGAGQGTGTVAVKHIKTETDDSAWDETLNRRRLKHSDDPILHHFVSENGEPGAASTRACIIGIAQLNGAHNGAVVKNRKEVYDHLASHLRDAGIEPPELRDEQDSSMRLKDHILIAVNEVEVVAARLADYKAKREKQGRNPSQDAQTGEMEIKQAAANARECLDSVDDLLTPKTGNPAEKLAEWQYRKARLKGLVDNT